MKIISFLTLSLALFFNGRSQVSGYTFSETSGTYTAITGGTVHQTGVALNTDAVFAGIPLGFSFTYDRNTYTDIGISNNGFIWFGASQAGQRQGWGPSVVPALTVSAPISSTTVPSGQCGIISGFGATLSASALGTPEIRSELLGTPGNYVFVIQYQDVRSSTTDAVMQMNFQIQLIQSTNSVAIVYGNCLPSSANRTGQVGLRGGNNTDYSNRLVTAGWNASVTGTGNTNTCTYSATNVPTSGQTWTWAPPAAPAAPVYGALGVMQTFDGAWLNWANTQDVPTTNWGSWPSRGNSSWRQNTTTTVFSGWGGVNGAFTVASPASGNTARFHSYDSRTTQIGNLDYYLDFSTSILTKQLTFNYINTSGTDSLKVFLSTDGGLTFGPSVSVQTIAPAWNTVIVNLGTSTSSTCVVRFSAVGDWGTTDIGLDNVIVEPVAPIDMGATMLVSPLVNGCFTSTETVTVTIRNYGTNLIDFSLLPVSVDASVTGPNPQTFTTVIVNTGTLAPNATQNVVVATGYDMSAAGTYTFSAFTTVAGDGLPANDAMAAANRVVVSVSASIPPVSPVCQGSQTNLQVNFTPSYVQPMSFTYAGLLNIPDNFLGGIDAPFTVSGVPGSYVLSSITLDTLTHTFDNDMDISILAPDASQIDLCSDNGGAGDNFYNTVFSMSAVTPVTAGVAPFSGMFLPEQSFSLLTGPLNGTWYLRLVDDLGGDVGALRRATITFTDANAGYYSIASYSWAPAAGLSSVTVANPVASPTVTTTYTVTATAVNGCTYTATVTVNVNTLPAVALGPDQSVCGGLLLDAGNPGSTYLWNTSATTQTINATATGIYSVIVTDGNGCSNTDVINLTVFPAPSLSLGPDFSQCGGSALLTASGNWASYLWSTSATTQSISVSTGGSYLCTVTDLNGCTTTDTINVTIYTPPTVTLGSNQTQCGGTVLLDAGNPGASYLWNNNATTQQITVSSSAIYSVVVTDMNGCTASASVTITIHPIPAVALGPDISQCGGTILLDAGNPGSGYQWSNAATTQQISVTASGSYSVVVTNVFGCSNSDTINITIFTPPAVTLGNDTTLCGDSLLLDAGNPGSSYVWSNSASTQQIFVSVSGTYSVIVTDVNGCSATDVIIVNISQNPVFSVNDTSICQGNSVMLIAPPGYAAYEWTDGIITSSQQFITVAPAQTTQYVITVWNGAGCFSTDTVTVTVLTVPSPSFSFNITSLNNVSFTNTSVTPPFSSVWDFGDGSPFSTLTNPNHVYASNGTYNVVLTVSNQCGSTSTFQSVVISGLGMGELNLNGMISAYPNPSNGTVTFSGKGLPEGELLIRTMDLSGRQLEIFRKRIAGGDVSQELDLSLLPNGIYTLEVFCGTARGYFTVSLQK
ncbi:MAG: PKD domain-containing protein [Bacteroidia bacterium]|nr:PKD domain-containing protein [Bacteroidia bacterium]